MPSHPAQIARRDCLAALVALALVHPALGAQKACASPTEDASASVTYYLIDEHETPWLRSRGIMATSAAQLSPLTDAADAALCVRLDSVLSIRPTHYFRAGSYVIATTARPFRLRNMIDYGTEIFVFDSAGKMVNTGGEYRSRTLREAAVLNAVLKYRRYWQGDSTAFDACRVYTVLGRPEDFSGLIEAPYRVMVNTESPCESSKPVPSDLVILKSITIDKIASTVALSVQHGDYVHDETYRLFGPPWGVDSVVLRGMVTITRPH